MRVRTPDYMGANHGPDIPLNLCWQDPRFKVMVGRSRIHYKNFCYRFFCWLKNFCLSIETLRTLKCDVGDDQHCSKTLAIGMLAYYCFILYQ